MGIHTVRSGVGAPNRFQFRAVLAAGLTAVLVPLSLGMMPTAANAAGETLNVIVQQTDGTPAFDALDANATNGIVRTNDTVGYKISVQSNGGAQTSPTIVFDLPKGQQLVSLPNYCLTGSSVAPPTLGDLPLPLTSTSWESYPVQTVTCVVASRGVDPVTVDYDFTAKVMAEVPNGTLMDPFDATVTSTAISDGATITDTSNTVQVSVAAQAGYDLSKNGTSSLDDNTGRVDIQTTTCTNQSFVTAGFTGCQTMLFPILVSVQAQGKGNTPLASDITFVDDISPNTIWGAGTTSDADWNPAFAPAVLGCGIVTGNANGASFYPFGAVAGHTTTNSVTNSGSITCAPGATGPVTVTIAGADTSAQDYPTTNGTGNVVMPGDKAYVVSGWIKVEYPTAAINALGQENPSSPGSFQLPYENTFSGLTATDIGGESVVEANLDNNARGGTALVDVNGTFGKFFEGEPGNTANSGGNGYAAGAYAGPPGSTALRDGEGVVQAGGRALSGINSGFVSPPGFGGVTQVICDAWDNSKISLTAADWQGTQPGTTSPAAAPGTAGYMQANPSNGASVWLSGVNGPLTPSYTVEYSNGTPGATTANSCNDETTGWFSDPALVPGNDAAQAAAGIYTGVSRVRIVAQLPKTDIAQDLRVDTAFSIGFTVRDTVVTGDVIGNWASVKALVGTTVAAPTEATVLASAGTYERLSNYEPTNHTGTLGDRLKVQSLTARLIKQVFDPSNNQYVSTGVPIYAAGVPVNYRLQPSLSAGVTTGATAPTIVEDCLPAYQTFSSSSLEGGGAIVPELISTDANPAGAVLDCAAGQTYVRWNLGSPVINTAIPAILYTVDIAATAPNGILTNTAMITAEGDASTEAARTDTGQIQIQTPTGIKLSKTVVNPLIEVNPADATNPRPLIWNLQFAAIDTSGVTNVEVIDVLPTQGANGTSYTGTLAFDSATSSSSAGATRILYTSKAAATVSLNPDDASNGATGSTVWCDAPSGGAVVSGTGTAADCPTAASNVTGLRIQKQGAFPANATVDATVRMIALGNTAGDVYNNRAQADATGVIQGVGPVQRAITVIASSVGDYVWNDVNGNGIQDAGEPAVPGFPVSVTGTDVDGNVITRTTTTDAAGKYLFDGLPSGEYTVTFEPAGLGDTYSFTQYQQGTDPALDSDADQTTGEAPTVTLGQNEQRLDVDAGLTRNQTASIVLTKVVVDPDTSDTAGDATSFPVTVTCTVPENPTPIVINTTVAADGTPTTVSELPVGATCVIVETDTDGGIVSYSAEAGTVTTIGEPVDVTITNTFPGTSVTKKVVGAPVKNADGSYTITYDVTVSNTGEVPTDYTVEDELHYGVGMIVNKAEVTDSPEGVELNDGWNGTSDLVIAEDVAIPVDGVHVYTVEVTATVPATVTSGARNCEVGGSETGTGFLNTATVSTELGETTASDCAPAPEEPVVTKPATPTGSLPNTGTNATMGLMALIGLLLAGGIALAISRKRRSA